MHAYERHAIRIRKNQVDFVLMIKKDVQNNNFLDYTRKTR